jgi:hypothetical protein
MEVAKRLKELISEQTKSKSPFSAIYLIMIYSQLQATQSFIFNPMMKFLN